MNAHPERATLSSIAPFFIVRDVEPSVAFYQRLGFELLYLAPWDAFVHTPDPDALAREFEERHVSLHAPLTNDDSGLRGFEVRDPDGYVLYFGRPV